MRMRGVFQVAVAIAAVVTLVLGSAASSYGPTPTATWVVSGGSGGGTVEAVAVSGSTAYVGGDFAYMGPETGSFVSLDSTSGAVTSPWPVVGGTVNAVVSDGSGGWFIGGSFASIGTRHADNIAHINADGTLDTGFTGGTDGPVYTLAATPNGSIVFAGGFFTHASDGTLGSQARASLAAFDGTSGTVRNFGQGVGPSGAFVSALELSGLTLYVGGSFATLGGVARDNLGAVTLAGAVTLWDPRTNDFVNSIAVGPGPANTVYVGGFFHAVNGNTTRNFAAAFDPSTGTATAWNPDVGVVTSNPPIDAVYAVKVSGSTVYLGGHFDLVGGQPRDSLAAVDATNGAFTTWSPSVVGAVYQLAISGSTVYAAGSFQNVNNVPLVFDNLAALNATTGATTAFSPTVGGDVFALAATGTKVVVGGSFRSAGVVSPGNVEAARRDNLGAIDLTTGQATGWNPHVNGTVFALAATGSVVYAGGDFTTVNAGIVRHRLAAFDTTDAASDTGWNPNVNNTVFALSVLGTTVYAGGAFTNANNGVVGRNHVAAFTSTGNGTAIPSWNPNANGFVYALDSWNNTVYLGGQFTAIGPLPRTRLASVSVSGTTQTWNPAANNTVYTLAHANGTEYAGGAFTTVNGNVARGAAAAFDPATGTATSWNPRLVLDSGQPAIVIALAPTLSTMYLGGFFDRQNTGNCTPNCFFAPDLAAISLTNGNALTTWQPAPNGAVNALAIGPQGVVAGGAFSALGYPPSGAAYAADEPAATYRGGVAALPGLPDAPLVTATPGDASATVTVQLPAFVGGGSVVGYTVTSFPGNVSVSSPTSPITVPGLTNGTPYNFSVTVSTTVGTGAAGVSSFVVPHTVPGAPPSVTAVPADISAVVSFTAPASDGGDPISSYTVTSSPDGITASGPRSPIEVRGLHNGTSYTFTVTATNSAGTGPPSAPSDPVVPAEGGRPHPPAPEGLPRPDVPPVPTITNPRVPPPHQG